jgi:hypothetical protein
MTKRKYDTLERSITTRRVLRYEPKTFQAINVLIIKFDLGICKKKKGNKKTANTLNVLKWDLTNIDREPPEIEWV